MIQAAAIDIFQELKQRIPIVDAFNYYGVPVNHHNKALCPFHNEKTPSLRVYPDTESFYCYGCGSGGDIFTFVQIMLNVDALEAAKTLDRDFGINLCGHKLTPGEKAKYAAEKAKRIKQAETAAAYRKWEDDYYDYLCKCIRLFEDLAEKANPSKCNGAFTDVYATAINRLQILEYHMKILDDDVLEDKLQLYTEVNRCNTQTSK